MGNNSSIFLWEFSRWAFRKHYQCKCSTGKDGKAHTPYDPGSQGLWAKAAMQNKFKRVTQTSQSIKKFKRRRRYFLRHWSRFPTERDILADLGWTNEALKKNNCCHLAHENEIQGVCYLSKKDSEKKEMNPDHFCSSTSTNPPHSKILMFPLDQHCFRLETLEWATRECQHKRTHTHTLIPGATRHLNFRCLCPSDKVLHLSPFNEIFVIVREDLLSQQVFDHLIFGSEDVRQMPIWSDH